MSESSYDQDIHVDHSYQNSRPSVRRSNTFHLPTPTIQRLTTFYLPTPLKGISLSGKKKPPSGGDSNESDMMLFHCVGCSSFLTLPVFQCKQGHNVCGACKGKHRACPSCNKRFLKTRNFLAEKAITFVRVPCENASSGCESKVLIKDMGQHVTECPHRPRRCSLDSGCPWEGVREEILPHVKKFHNWCQTCDSEDVVSFCHADFREDIDSSFVSLLSMVNEIFWFNLKRDCIARKLLFLLRYIGPVECANDFRYELEFRRTGASGIIVFADLARNDVESVCDIFVSRECIAFDFSLVEHYLDEDKTLRFKLSISKVGEKKGENNNH